MRARIAAVVVVALGCLSFACAGPYRAGALVTSPDGRPLTNGRELRCLESTVSVLPPLPAQSVSSVRLAFAFGNRCPEAVRVDFGAVVVEASFEDGTRERLEPVATARAGFDEGTALPLEPIPASAETLNGVLDGYAQGRQMILFAAATPAEKAPQHPTTSVCVDVSRLETLETGSPEALPPICFNGRNDPVSATTLDASAKATVAPDASYAPSEENLSTHADLWERGPRLSAALGLSTHHLGLRGRSLTGGDSYGAPATVAADPLGSAQAESVDSAIRWGFLGPLYLGGELQLGGSSIARGATTLSPGFSIDGGGFYAAGGLLLGVTAPREWRLTARAELFAGGWATSTRVGASPAPENCADGSPCTDIGAWSLEPRVRLDAWITPWLSVGAWSGMGVLQPGDWSAGLAIATYGRSFDGP